MAVFNVDGTFYAIGGKCTHRDGLLGEGELDGTVVTCPWRGAQCDVTTGQVVGLPAGQSVPAYTVVVHGDDIHVDVSEGATYLVRTRRIEPEADYAGALEQQ